MTQADAATALLETVAEGLAATGERRAVWTAARSVTGTGLLGEVRRVGEDLVQAGVRPGCAVVVAIPNEVEQLVAVLACASIGAVSVPVDPSLTDTELERSIAVLGDGWLLVQSPRSRRVMPDRPRALIDAGRLVECPPLDHLESKDELERTAMVQLTSGSEGGSKGITIGAEALLERGRALWGGLGLGGGDRTLCALPLSHSHGIDCMALPSLLFGAELFLLPPTAAAPHTVLKLIERERIAFFSSVPGFYDLTVRLLDEERFDLSALRVPGCGSAALAPATAERFLDAFGHAIRQGYGLAEIGALMVDVDAGENRTFGSVGRPLPGVRCRLTEEGEIVASSPALANGYLGRPDLWAEVVRDGELHTSDLARVDEDGRYFLTGRRSRLMNLDGRQVHPSEVEEVLLEVDAVREVIVVAEGSPARVVAHVATAGEVDAVEELLREHCRTRLSAWKCPGRYRFHDQLPRSSVGKLLPGRLAEEG